MVINDVPKITDEVRDKLAQIFNSQYEELKDDVNFLLSYPEGEYAHEFDYHNIYSKNKNNIVRLHDGSYAMSVFNFNIRNTVRIFRLLKIEEFKPEINAIRVFSGNVVPMHLDLNKGNIGREYPILSVVVSGNGGMVFMSSVATGDRQAAVPGKTEFVMFPTHIHHGAMAGPTEHYDLLQIQLTSIV